MLRLRSTPRMGTCALKPKPHGSNWNKRSSFESIRSKMSIRIAREKGGPVALKHSSLIYDWNNVSGAALKPAGRAMLTDETLRDGLQSPSVKDPTIEDKIEILHLMDSLGINHLDLGLPGAGPRAVADVERLAREIVTAKLRIRPNCAARTHENDIRPVAEISQRVGIS